jgi:hypothetical protein
MNWVVVPALAEMAFCTHSYTRILLNGSKKTAAVELDDSSLLLTTTLHWTETFKDGRPLTLPSFSCTSSSVWQEWKDDSDSDGCGEALEHRSVFQVSKVPRKLACRESHSLAQTRGSLMKSVMNKKCSFTPSLMESE